MLAAYIEAWDGELEQLGLAGEATTDPIGTILAENDGTNENLEQFFTPPSVVRLINAVDELSKLKGLIVTASEKTKSG